MPELIDCSDVRFAEPLSELGRRTFVDAFGHLYKAEDMLAFLDAKHAPAYYEKLIANPRIRIWGLKDGSTFTGYCVAGPCDLPVPDMPPRSGLLDRLYLDRTAQGAGAGSRMLEIALGWLHENFDHIYVSVFSENYGAQRLYERVGFEKVHEYYFMVGNHPDHEFIMKLKSHGSPK